MIDIAKQLVFTDKGHIYRLNGAVVPSITQALKVAQYDQFDFVNPAVLAARAAEGTMLHKMIEVYEEGKDAYSCAATDAEWDMIPDLVDDLDAYLEFKSKSGFIVETTEQMVASERHRFAGRLDLTGRFPGDEVLWIIDTKRTAAIPKSVGAQTAAQEAGWRETFDVDSSVQIKRAALHLRNGKHKLVEQKSRSDHALFLSCLNVTHWRMS